MNGLVLCLDAANTKSYSGPGATTWTDLTNSRSSLVAVGQSAYTTAGTFTFTVPSACTSISAVTVGGGGGGGNDTANNEAGSGGGGGGLAYQASIAVTPGESLTVVVGSGGGSNTAGGQSRIHRSGTNLVAANGGGAGQSPDNGNAGGTGGTVVVGTGGVGGAGGATADGNTQGAGGGGAGGYSGTGGRGQDGDLTPVSTAGVGGGGGGGGQNAGGGGVGILGTTGVDGTAGGDEIGGGAGSGGTAGSNSGVNVGAGGTYGGGGAGAAGGDTPGSGAGGAVRIIWGTGRSYPSTTVTDQTTVVGFDNTLNNAQLINAPTYSSANNGILTFNNISTYATVNSNASILSNTAYTKIAWFNTNNLAAANNIISGGVSGQHAFWLNATNTLRAGHNGIWDTVVSSTTLSANTWYCGAVTFNTTTGWVLYLNGSVVDTDVSTTTFTGNGEILICAFTLGGNLFSGSIATASVYNRALSAAEIRQNFNALRGRFGI